MDKNIPLYRKFLMHLETVNHHRAEVMKNCFACGLYRQGLTHDLSKYEPAEFLVSVKYFQGYRSPYIYEKELHGYSLGWLHHKGVYERRQAPDARGSQGDDEERLPQDDAHPAGHSRIDAIGRP